MNSALTFLIIVFSLLASLALLREYNKLLLFRLTTLIFSISVIGMFNINWLTDIAVKSWAWAALFVALFLLALISRKENIFEKAKLAYAKNKAAYLFSVIIFSIAFLFASSYFHWDLNVPRYFTPDSGTHFLYMSETAKNGKMALFGKDLIEEASGNVVIGSGPNETYFPGATAAFAFLETLIKPANHAMMLQVFNTLCYAILSGYFILLFYTRKIIKEKITLAVLVAVVLLGPFFNLVATSHSTQLLGLLFLIAFVDFFEAYLQKKESSLPAALTFGAMIMTYFYWLPVALAFVAIRIFFLDLRVKNYLREFLRAILPLATGFVFCFGYVVVMFKLNMFQYSSADGGVAFQDYLLSGALWIAPFAAWQLFSLLRNWKTNSNDKKFIAAFFGGVAVFALMLAILYKNGVLISHYSAMKILYLVVPSVWLLALMFLEEKYTPIKMFFVEIIKKDWNVFKTFKKQLVVFVFLFLLIVGVAKIFNIDWKFFGIVENNFKLVLNNKIEPVLSHEQMELLDELKNKHADLIENGQILIIAPAKNSLWAFAYSGLWPRTKSLILMDGSSSGLNSELGFYSDGIANYGVWLKQDKKHALVYFDTDESLDWIGRSMIDIDDYEVLEKRGNNKLLKLRSGVSTKYAFDWKDFSDKSEKNELPLQIDFISLDNVLSGVSMRFQVDIKKNVKNDIALELFSEKCGENSSKKEIETRIAKEDLIRKGEKRTSKIIFDKVFLNAKNKNFCIKLSVPDEKTAKAVRIARFEDGSYEINPVYSFLAD